MTNQKDHTKTAYYREQKRRYRAKNRTVTISLPKTIAREWERDAKSYQLSLPKYVKACAESYRNQSFIVPNQQQARALELQLSGIGNNINQIARQVNSRQIEPQQGVEQVRMQLHKLEQQFDGIIRAPWNLETYIHECLTCNPQLPFMLHQILIDHLKTLTYAHQNSQT